MPISAAEPEKKFLQIDGKRMAYVEMGSGRPIVFQHGNPTSSYLWRNVMPHVAAHGRCIAVDLMGFGDSDALDAGGHMAYSLAEHARWLDRAWAALGIDRDVVLVLHDWGGFLGFDWARRHESAVSGIAYMETIVSPIAGWDDWPEGARRIFQAMRSEAGEEMVLEKNVFVERILPSAVLRGLTEAEMAVYRRRFATPGESRRPTLDFPRQIPIAGEPPEIVAAVGRYAEWLAQSDIPKLFVDADPGSILTGPQREFCRGWPNQTEVAVRGAHFLQEDSPDEIGRAVAAFVAGLRAG